MIKRLIDAQIESKLFKNKAIIIVGARQIGKTTSINFVLKNKHKELEFDKFYLCGPEEMINKVTDVLKEHNVKDSAIKFELFASSTAENTIEKSLSGHSKITIMVDDEETTLKCLRNKRF